MANTKANTVSFNVNTDAVRVVAALKAFDNAAGKARDTIAAAFQHMIDGANMAGIKRDEPGTKLMMDAIRNAPAFVEAIAIGAMESKTRTEYVQSAGRAFFHGVPFSASLKNDKDMALPWGKAKPASDAGKAGKVESTTREALDETICKVLKQARLLGLTGFAADLLDLTMEALEGFTETPAK